MKYLTYIFRNARRNPIRSVLTIASTSICLFLMMILLSFFEINNEVNTSTRIYNRIATLNANGFAGVIPISAVNEVARLEGVAATTPFSWIGGKYNEETVPFAQFGVDPETIFKIMDEFVVPPAELTAFQQNRDGCVIGRKLANDWKLKVGDSMPIKGDAYPVDLNLTVRGIYDGPPNRDLRMCLVRWDYFDECLKRSTARVSGNAGMIFTKCKTAADMPRLCKQIDENFHSSDFPTRTQTEEAFGKMFAEMMGDLQGMIRNIGLAVIFSLLCVAGNAMAMSMRERTTEVAVLKAIGFSKPLILTMVLTEAILVSGAGGVLGSFGSKLLCDVVDLSKYTAGFLPFFFVPWNVAFMGMGVAFGIGLLSGILPAIRAANLPVIDGLRRVI